jgi:ABC-type multidrug transport system fused ATPase/permease subunit
MFYYCHLLPCAIKYLTLQRLFYRVDAETEEQRKDSQTNYWSNISIHHFVALCSISLLLFLLSMTHRILYFFMFAQTTTILHNNMFKQIIGAPVRFFDVNPVGIILNRFSQDMGMVDKQLSMSMLDALDVSIFNHQYIKKYADQSSHMIKHITTVHTLGDLNYKNFCHLTSI